MTVIAFAQKKAQASGAWRASELDQLVGSFAAELAGAEAASWAAGATETGDPQFYLLGPPPDEECILCVSRLGRTYVLEDGAGRILFEHVSFELLADQAKAFLRGKRAALWAQVTVLWGAMRQALEEKIEPILAEGEDVLMHFAPQLAALA
jgi:hypothetical protein